MTILSKVVWVLNGFFLLLPITNPAGSFSGESEWGGGVSAVVGATIFEVGSVLLMIEAVNENRSECFGLALKAEFEHSEENLLKLTWDKSACRHHHAEKSSWLSRKGHAIPADAKDDSGGDGPIATAGEEDVGAIDPAKRKWTWWPSWYELRTHYFRDIGFLACFSQMFGATVFWISGFTGLPQILNVLSVPAANGIYWLPQVSNSPPSSPLINASLCIYTWVTVKVQQHDPRTLQRTESNTLLTVAPVGYRGHGLHRLQLALHARDPEEVVYPRPDRAGLAHWVLEPHRSPRVHPLRRPRVRLE